MIIILHASRSKFYNYRNCINLLTNIPAKYTDPLLSSPDSTLMSSSYQREEYNGQCMSSTHTMMDFLVARCSGSQTGLREALTPVLTVMIKLARHHRSVRKYLRNAILPPLNCNDLDRRPEESNSPRGSLCKLLTSPLDDVAYTAAVAARPSPSPALARECARSFVRSSVRLHVCVFACLRVPM